MLKVYEAAPPGTVDRGNGTAECQVCGATFCFDDPEDVRSHGKSHRRFLKLSEKYAVVEYGDHLWTYDKREDEKAGARDVVPDKSYPIGVRVSFAQRGVYAWYSRSVLGYEGYERDAAKVGFVHFAEYVAMCLGAPMNHVQMYEPVRRELTKIFGEKPGWDSHE